MSEPLPSRLWHGSQIMVGGPAGPELGAPRRVSGHSMPSGQRGLRWCSPDTDPTQDREEDSGPPA